MAVSPLESVHILGEEVTYECEIRDRLTVGFAVVTCNHGWP